MALRQSVIDPALGNYAGRIVKNTGDGFIAIFEAIRDAALCAIAIQQEVERKEADEPAEWRIRFQIGLNAGDIIEEGYDVYGNAVNIAARLQELAEPGAVVMSAIVRHRAPSIRSSR